MFIRFLLFVALCLSTTSYAEHVRNKNTLDPWKAALVDEAIKARKKSYAPYSNYMVGAAVQTKKGKIYHGTNIENASYSLTNCAERTAIFKAISNGDLNLKAIAVVTQDGGFPCGACRQVLNEFNPEMIIITSNVNGTMVTEHIVSDLLPNAFGPKNLNK